MNLQFHLFQDFPDHYIESADVTDSAQYWRYWREATNLEAEARSIGADPPKSIKNFVELRKLDDRWLIFRKISKKSEKPVSFNLKYTMRDTSLLRPYQPLCVAHLCDAILRNNAAADGSATGLGKTYMALAVCRELSLNPFIVCKKSGVSGWMAGCRFMGVAPVAIGNWEYLRTGKTQYVRRAVFNGLTQFKWYVPSNTLIIFDEQHYACNDGTLNNKMYRAARDFPTLSCSATFADRPVRLRSLFDMLRIIPFNRYYQWLEDMGHFRNDRDAVESLSETQDMLKINKMVYPKHGYRLSYDQPEVKKYFPRPNCQVEIVDLGDSATAKQNAMYQKALVKIAQYKSDKQNTQAFTADLRYRQMTEAMKLDTIIEYTYEYLYEGLSVCIFVNFRDSLLYLAKRFDTKSLIFGEQEKFGIDRDRVIGEFQSNQSRLLVATVDAGGESINLHDLDGHYQRISLICPTYNAIKLLQVMGRTHRTAMKSIPIIKLFYAAKTIEEKVAQAVSMKIDNIGALNDGDLMEPDLFSLRKGSL